MPVYVDDMNAEYRRMKMCHMIADTEDELHAMADKIGVARRWHQAKGTPRSHYDICLSKRALAVDFGAREITQRDTVKIVARKREALASNAKVNGGAAAEQQNGELSHV
jgi:hypothetical protein